VPVGIAEIFATSHRLPSLNATSTASQGDCECMVVRNRKGFIALALESGSHIVPCYCFGNTQIFTTLPSGNSFLEYISRVLRTSIIVFWGRWWLPIPHRVPLLTVIGKPIKCPKVTNPSAELINEYHERYLQATRDIYEKYRNMYGWSNRPLIFKR